MSLDWLPRDDEIKNHALYEGPYWGTEPPCVVFEKRPLVDPQGNVAEGLHTAWITLNNPKQYNSYTTPMVKGVIAAFTNASLDRSVVSVVFTGAGDRAFCTGGNTVEYSEYYSKRPQEYGDYMDLFNAMVDSILNCKKPVICRVNGMRVAGGQEIGTACDIAITSDLAVFGQAGPRHGSAAVGGVTDFLPWFLSIEDAMWSTISCELWSAYKMKAKCLVSKVVPALKTAEGNYVRNPLVITDTYVEDGEIVYGESKRGEALAAGKQVMENCTIDLSMLDAAVNGVSWHLANLFPGSLQMSIDQVRAKKKFFWDQAKLSARHWLAANMMGEAYLGFHAFSTRKQTGADLIDFVRYRQLLAQGALMDDAAFEQIMPSPKE